MFLLLASAAAPVMTIALVRIGAALRDSSTQSRSREQAEAYVRDHMALAASLSRRPGIYRVDLFAEAGYVRIEGLVEDARRFRDVEQALYDANELPESPDISLRIRNGDAPPQDTNDTGYLFQKLGATLVTYAAILVAVWLLLVALGMGWVVAFRASIRPASQPPAATS